MHEKETLTLELILHAIILFFHQQALVQLQTDVNYHNVAQLVEKEGLHRQSGCRPRIQSEQHNS